MAKGAWGLPQWLERGVADLFPAGVAEGAAQDPDQQLAARLRNVFQQLDDRFQFESRHLRERFGR